jgi:hypothetical protein
MQQKLAKLLGVQLSRPRRFPFVISEIWALDPLSFFAESVVSGPLTPVLKKPFLPHKKHGIGPFPIPPNVNVDFGFFQASNLADILGLMKPLSGRLSGHNRLWSFIA